MGVEREKFGSDVVERVTLTNKQGTRVGILTYGATIQSIYVKSKDGVLDDVVLGFDDLDGYKSDKNCYMGSTVGRVANRTSDGRLPLDDTVFHLTKNEKESTHLHGGYDGFSSKIWRIVELGEEKADLDVKPPSSWVKLRYCSPDGEEGYPGNVTADILFTLLRDEDTLTYEVSATTDKTTAVNMTNHSYFNLRGHSHVGDAAHVDDTSVPSHVGDTSGPSHVGDTSESGVLSILDHTLHMPSCRRMLIFDGNALPTGEIHEIPIGSPFDFATSQRRIGERITEDHPMLKNAKGYDLCFPLDDDACYAEMGTGLGGSLTPQKRAAVHGVLAARVSEPLTGRVMECWTTHPGLQLYTGNWIAGCDFYKAKAKYGQWSGFCLETQNYPDAANKQPLFPPSILRPGQTYRQSTTFRFFSSNVVPSSKSANQAVCIS